MFVVVNGIVSPPTVTPSVTTLLQSHSETNMTSASLQKITYLNWESLIESFVNDSMTKAMPYALKERKSETELAFTALVSGNLRKLVPYEKAGEEDVRRVFSMHLHVSLYTPFAFGVRKNGAHLAVVGYERDVANAKYSDWVRMRKPLEKLRPPSATELLLSNDGDHILEGCLTNFFVLCRQDNMEEDGESAENTLVVHGMLGNWNPYGLRLLQHVDTIRVPVSWNSLSSKTWKEVTWEAKEFEEEVVKRAKLEGHPIKAFIT
uniref:D-aminoacid aminotransferase-like PLP-dependent enzymes superfamily protein n=1 Tax=Tanacetum cinerariifolium TaxID=118510 RepID=A0A6L2LMF7_TANCI|nr:D-aminoacid aminotransferase-like PLP-dependent enzymes superfamily protein [Tanacetum cinerariifolium]